MFGKPSLRRRLIGSYLVVVIAVIGAVFVTVQGLVPQFFERAVQERVGPSSENGPNQQQGNPESPGSGPSGTSGTDGPSATTDAPSSDAPATTEPAESTTSTTTTPPQPTGSTIGPGGTGPDPGQGDGEPGGNPDPGGGDRGGATTTTIDAFGPGAGVSAAAPMAASTERSPVPEEIQQDYDRALTSALVIATIIGLVIALALGWLLTRRILRAFTGIKEGASRLADGHYGVRVPVPAEVELADLAESVNTLADSLQRTEQSRARLVSDLAHEIRNPLSTIEGYMEGLIDGVLPESRETYEAIAAEAHRLKRLTWDLSTLSKAQEGAIEYSFETLDLNEVVKRVVNALLGQYEINDVDLIMGLEADLPCRIDTDRIAQSLTNLLGNALAHTPPGGAVTVGGSADSRWCRLTVTDTGDGIPESQLETIFERFTRLDGTHAGTGIGLNIARTLVRAHGGDVIASSPGPGKGSTFEIKLPRHSEH